MRRDQLSMLTATATELFEKGRLCTKVSECNGFVELGLKCMAEARAIEEGLRRNSVALFIECSVRAKEHLTFDSYLDFCARNSLDTLSETDFDTYLFTLWQEWEKADASRLG